MNRFFLLFFFLVLSNLVFGQRVQRVKIEDTVNSFKEKAVFTFVTFGFEKSTARILNGVYSCPVYTNKQGNTFILIRTKNKLKMKNVEDFYASTK